jgi:1-deoxy-D-xylulose-5-phosphate synthase
MLGTARKAASILADSGIDCGVVNARFLKPLDETMLNSICAEYKHILVLEASVRAGSLGEEIASLAPEGAKVSLLCVPDRYIPAGTVAEQQKMCGLDAESAANAIRAAVKEDERG